MIKWRAVGRLLPDIHGGTECSEGKAEGLGNHTSKPGIQKRTYVQAKSETWGRHQDLSTLSTNPPSASH